METVVTLTAAADMQLAKIVVLDFGVFKQAELSECMKTFFFIVSHAMYLTVAEICWNSLLLQLMHNLFVFVLVCYACLGLEDNKYNRL